MAVPRGSWASGRGAQHAVAPTRPDTTRGTVGPVRPGTTTTAPVNEAMAERTPTSSDSRPRSKQRPRPRNGWQLLGVTAVGLVLAVVLGWFGGILTGKAFGPQAQEDRATPSSSAPATPTGGGETAGEPIQIAGATLFDPPPGDGEENPDRVGLSYDGLPGTTWPTLQYQGTAMFGNIKPGVGIIYDLGGEKTISKVDLVTTLPGSTVEIRVGGATSGTVDQFPVVAGPVELQTNTSIEIPDGVSTRYVLVWITELVPQQGYFQAALSEVTIYS
jgi:hypothetical protein